MKKFFLIALILTGVFLTTRAVVSATSYEETVAQ
jgi:hypothetical protein